MTKASRAELLKLDGWPPLDLEAIKQRQYYVARGYSTALVVWAGAVAFCLCGMVLTGSAMFFILGYGVTVPFLIACYRYKGRLDNVTVLNEIEELDHEVSCDRRR